MLHCIMGNLQTQGHRVQVQDLPLVHPPFLMMSRMGVSVGNALIEKRKWFVLRVSYGRIIKAKDFAEAKGLECYVPMRHKQIMKHGKKLIITEPLLPSFLFVHATRSQVGVLLCDCSNKNYG